MDIYQYDDFRLFLKEAFDAKKSSEPSFTYRKFSAFAGVKNPGLLLDIIKGKRRLSSKVLKKSVDIFELKPLEAEFFELLVNFGQTRRADVRQSLYKEILNRRNHSNFVRLNPGQTRYYEDTNYALVVAAIEAAGFAGDYEALSSFLNPPLTAGKVKKYVRDLCDWGLVKQEADGKYIVVFNFLEPPSTLKLPVKNMNRDWIQQAGEALFNVPQEQRHISTAILTVSSQTREHIKDKIEQFRREVIELVKADTNPQDVMQFTMVYYPKSRIDK